LSKMTLDSRMLIVVGSFVTQFTVIGCLFAYGVFFTALEAELGWSRTLLSVSTSLAFLISGCLAIVAGRLSDRFGPRWVLTASGVVFGCGYALLSTAQEPWHMVLLFGVFLGIGMCTTDVVTLSAVARWFTARRGVMTAIVKIGTACGQVIMPLVAALVIAAFGWRIAFFTIGLFALVVLLGSAQLLKFKPTVSARPGSIQSESVHSVSIPAEPVQGVSNESSDSVLSDSVPLASTQNDANELPFSAVCRMRQFWIFCGIQFAFLPALMTIPVHIAAHGVDLGMSTSLAAGVLSTIGAVSILGRFSLGLIIDRVGGRFGLLICFLLLLASLLWLRWLAEPLLLFAFAIVYGFAHGGLFTTVSPTLAEYFGMAAHGTIFGVVVFFGTLGGAAGPLLTGWVFDSSGSYLLAFNALAVLAAVGLVLALSLGRPKHELIGQ